MFALIAPYLSGLEPVPPSGTIVEISTKRDIFMGIVSCPATTKSAAYPEAERELNDEQRLWEETQGLATARHLMTQSKAVFWGCPEGTFTLQISDEPSPVSDRSTREFSALLNSSGEACVTSSGNLALSLLYPDTFSLPVTTGGVGSYTDTLIELPEGLLVVTVTQMFRWKRAQFASSRPRSAHYFIHLRPAKQGEKVNEDEMPWLALDLPR